MSNKIGVGVITCNRENFYKQCIDSIPSVDEIVVVNDGNPYAGYTTKPTEVIEHDCNKCVGVSKNDALKYLISKNCDHIFIVEDDMRIKNSDIFMKYIHTAEESGIWHLNFAYHGNGNMRNGAPAPLMTIPYKKESISLNANCVGAFSYYYKGVIDQIGYIDEYFKNCWEHVEHTYRIIKKGLHPPFWCFADVAKSYDYIQELGVVQDTSIIRKSDDWNRYMQDGAAYFKIIHGVAPLEIPRPSQKQVLDSINTLRTNYSRILI